MTDRLPGTRRRSRLQQRHGHAHTTGSVTTTLAALLHPHRDRQNGLMGVEAESAVGLLIFVPTPIAMVDVACMVMTMRGMRHVMTVLLATRVAVRVRVAMTMSHVLHASVVVAGSVVVLSVAVRNLHARQQQMSGDCRTDRQRMSTTSHTGSLDPRTARSQWELAISAE